MPIEILKLLEQAFLSISLLLHDNLLGLAIGIIFLLAVCKAYREERKLPFLATSILLALLLGMVSKPFLSQNRPCQMAGSLVPCPDDFAMPSLHTLLAFALVFGSVGNRSFPAYFLFACFVGYSRIYLGVHDIAQVFAGISFALFAHLLAELSWKVAGWEIPSRIMLKASRKNAQNSGSNEWLRQAVHAFAAIFLIALVVYAGREAALHLAGFSLLFGIAISHLLLSGKSLPIVRGILAALERPNSTPGFGAMALAAGCLAIIAAVPNIWYACASLWIVGIGDSASTIFGRTGRARLFYNKGKTVEGTLAFFASCVPSMLFAGEAALAVSAIAAVIESMQSHADDNLLVSAICIFAFRLFEIQGLA
ncbi:MAG: phosphatase PAP2 family protein [Candidatus Anstonellaceae archaeon]